MRDSAFSRGLAPGSGGAVTRLGTGRVGRETRGRSFLVFLFPGLCKQLLPVRDVAQVADRAPVSF